MLAPTEARVEALPQRRELVAELQKVLHARRV
jgi:hypothetical protein